MPPEVASNPGHWSAIGWLIVCVAAAATAGNQIWAFAQRFREQPRPADTYATKHEMAEVVERWEKDMQEIRESLASHRKDRESDHTAFDGRLDTMRKEIRDDIRRLHDRLDNVPSNLIATLRNTGAIK